MKSHELAKALLTAPDCEVGCILNVTSEVNEDDQRFFGTLEEINHLPSNTGFGLNDAVLMFHGTIDK